MSKRNHDDDQLEFNWTYLQRKAWIDEAVLTPRKARDGKTVMPDKQRNLLHRINDHYGDNNRAWPSIDRLAALMDCHRTTVMRTIEVLADRMILSVFNDESRPGRHNVYMIIWTELQLLEPTRREAWLKLVFGKKVEESESRLGCDESRLGQSESRLGCDEGRLGRLELLKNNSQNKSKNSPPLEAQSDGEPEPDPWEVVVSDLLRFGMDRARDAVTAAQSRELTVDQVNELIERWERLRARQQNVTVGWLYRWLMGISRPPDESESTPAPTQASVSLTSESTRRFNEEIKLRKDLIRRKIFGPEQDRIVNETLHRSPVAQTV